MNYKIIYALDSIRASKYSVMKQVLSNIYNDILFFEKNRGLQGLDEIKSSVEHFLSKSASIDSHFAVHENRLKSELITVIDKIKSVQAKITKKASAVVSTDDASRIFKEREYLKKYAAQAYFSKDADKLVRVIAVVEKAIATNKKKNHSQEVFLKHMRWLDAHVAWCRSALKVMNAKEGSSDSSANS